jgi:predicted transcriptional regulator
MLGELELAVLQRLWAAGPADVKAMHGAVGGPRGLAPNTIQSTLERLHRKGLAERWKEGRAYRYAARVSPEAWLAENVDGLLGALRGADPSLLLAAFVDLAERTGPDQLDALERMIRERRRTPKERP